MAKTAKRNSRIALTIVVGMAWLLLAAAPAVVRAQPPAVKPSEPATVEEATRVLDLLSLPLPEGAKIQMRSLGMLMYSAKGTPKEAFEFQRTELTKRDFKEVRDRSASENSSHFTKDGFHVFVSASEMSGDPERAGSSQVSVVNKGNVSLDKLPVPPGVKPFFASPHEVSYTIAAKPTEAAAACRKLLLAAEWEPYGERKTPSPDQPDAGMQFFKRNAIQLQVWVMTTPAEGGKSLIRYSTELLSADLPAPPTAADLRYDDWQKTLTFEAPHNSTDAVVAFYQERLTKQNWKATTERPISDERRKSQFLIYRNPQKDLISLTILHSPTYLHVTLKHKSAAEVAAAEQLAEAEAQKARQEEAARNAPVNVALTLPAAAQKLQKKSASELEFELKTGSGPQALEKFRKQFLAEGWTEQKGREFGQTSGSVIFEKGFARVTCRYFDLGLSEVDVSVSGTKNVMLEVTAAGQNLTAAPSAAAQSPVGAVIPASPGLPALPPGVELPPEVSSLLSKALQEVPAKTASAKKSGASKVQPHANAAPPAKAPTSSSLAPNVAANAKTTAPAAVESGPAAPAIQRLATEKSLGVVGDLNLSKRDPKKPHFWVSPDGRHFAYLISNGIVIDGQSQKYSQEIKANTFRFSPDSQHTCYVAYVDKQGETLVLDGVPEKRGWNFIDHDGAVFSRDSQHVAYIARRYVGGGVEYAVVIDGVDREIIKESPAWTLAFTADGRRVVWGEQVNKRWLMRETSIDGSQPRIDRSHSPVVLTMNFFFGGGGQMGYIAKDDAGKHFVFYDGREDPLRFDEIEQLLLSADGKHLAYVAEPQSFDRVVVVDGKPSKVYGGLDADYVKGSLTLSADGRRSAYAIKSRNGIQAVIDGREGKPYRAVAGLVFSPDSKRVAYRAVLGNKLLIVVDGQEGPGQSELGLPVFSPDGKTVAAGAGAGKRKFIVVNNQNHKAYSDVGEPIFSPDSKRLVYEAEVEAGGQSRLVENGKEGKLYDDIKGRVYFSDDSRHVAIVAVDGKQQIVAVDGVEGNRYDNVITLGGGQVCFDAPDRLHYLAMRGGELYLVEEQIQP